MALASIRRAAPAQTPAPAAAKSRWGGIKSREARDPLLQRGTYLVELVGAEITFNRKSGNETFQTTVKVLHAEPGSVSQADSQCKILAIINGKSKDVGEGKVKAMSVAFAGYTSDDEYDAVDPEGAFIDETLNGRGFVGRTAIVEVTDTTNDSGKVFQDYNWGVSEDSEPMA